MSHMFLSPQLVKSLYVNICDLVDYSISRREVQLFDTLEDLAEYSRMQGKIYPRENAYAKGILRFLLREIFSVGRGRQYY